MDVQELHNLEKEIVEDLYRFFSKPYDLRVTAHASCRDIFHGKSTVPTDTLLYITVCVSGNYQPVRYHDIRMRVVDMHQDAYVQVLKV